MNHASLAINSFQEDKDASKVFLFLFLVWVKNMYSCQWDMPTNFLLDSEHIYFGFTCYFRASTEPKNKCNYVFSSILKFHLKSKWKVLTDNTGYSSKLTVYKIQQLCLLDTFLCFAVVFAALPKIPIIGKKVLMRTNQFLRRQKTWACFYYIWGTKKEMRGRSTDTSSHFIMTSVTPLLQQHLWEKKTKWWSHLAGEDL